jgi:DNA-binding SARP family transcriptional activator
MIQQSTLPDSLGLLIRNALSAAFEAGRPDIVPSLEAALSAAEESQRPHFELDVLAAEVRRGGHVVALSRGERALLVALALARRPQTRAELMELLYPHLEEAMAAIQLRVYVHRVRRRTGDQGVIVFQNDSYRLGTSVRVDFWDIEAEVAAAVRGNDTLSPLVKARLNSIRLRLRRRDSSWGRDLEWSIALERRLQVLLFDVTVRLGEAALAEGALSMAARYAAEIFDIDACDERGAELAIRTHLAAGDRSEAIRAFRRYERVLKNEFGAQPSSELTALIAN